MTILNQTLTCFEQYQQVRLELGVDVRLSIISLCWEVNYDVRRPFFFIFLSAEEQNWAVHKLQDRLQKPERALRRHGEE